MSREIRYTTAEQQIDILKHKGLKFDNEEIAKYNLERYGYYNIINSYKKPYQLLTENNKKVYAPEVTFEQIFSVFILDHNLRNSIMAAMLDFEEHLRASAAEVIASNYGTDHNNYLAFTNYRDRNSSNSRFSLNGILGTLRNNASSDKDPIKHYRECYGIIPPWILLKGTYFSTLVNYIKCFKNPQKQQLIRNIVDYPDDVELSSEVISLFQTALFVCLNYRNTAAHGGRMYNYQSTYAGGLVISDAVLEYFPKLATFHTYPGIHQLLLLLTIFKYRQPYDMIDDTLTNEVSTHLNQYPADLERISQDIGIPFRRTRISWVNEKSKIYHDNPQCSGLYNALQVSWATHDMTQYKPCKRCVQNQENF